MVQEETHGRAIGWGSGEQHHGHVPVVVLPAIPGVRVEGPLQAAGTVPSVAGVAFVAVQHGDAQPLNIGQGLVAFQARVDVVHAVPELFGIQQRMDAAQGVGAAGRLVQPGSPKASAPDLGPGVEAAQAGPEQDHGRFDRGSGRDARCQPPVRERRQDVPGKMEDLVRVPDQAAENG